jgi:hypothetical protein
VSPPVAAKSFLAIVEERRRQPDAGQAVAAA